MEDQKKRKGEGREWKGQGVAEADHLDEDTIIPWHEEPSYERSQGLPGIGRRREGIVCC